MKIGFIGAGKVGCSLGAYFGQVAELAGYASQSTASAEEAARLTGTQPFPNGAELLSNCDAVFITTPDSQINAVWEDLKTQLAEKNGAFAGKLVCHCSGAMASTELSGAEELGACVYSVHPLFAISSKTVSRTELGKAFFAVEGTPKRLDLITSMLEKLGNPYQVIKTEDKVRYHAAAALASNHVVALYRLACDELKRCGFTGDSAEKALAPLFLGNAEHIAHDGCIEALTGPAERGDMTTIQKHLTCLDGQTREVYELLNETLLQIAAAKHGEIKPA